MGKRESNPQKSHAFRNKLLLNQWLMSLLGIKLLDHIIIGKKGYCSFLELNSL
ncbi:MAG: JAB domain-containing protein [Candidatus Wallbacteria bacterium]|nr:JAB domain-containing protein [Candidatus Wallbacteria bacterium]